MSNSNTLCYSVKNIRLIGQTWEERPMTMLQDWERLWPSFSFPEHQTPESRLNGLGGPGGFWQAAGEELCRIRPHTPSSLPKVNPQQAISGNSGCVPPWSAA